MGNGGTFFLMVIGLEMQAADRTNSSCEHGGGAMEMSLIGRAV